MGGVGGAFAGGGLSATADAARREGKARRVRLLLESWFDYLPSPPHVQLKAPSGPVASKYVPCEPCARQGYIVYKGQRRLCFTCNGTGTRRRRVRDEEWCAYTELPLAEARALQQSAVVTRTSSVTDVEREQAFAWERRKASYRRHGSYDELERALDRMRVGFPTGFYALTRRYQWGVSVDEELEKRAIYWLAAQMHSIRVPRWVKDTSPVHPRELVLDLASRGLGAGQIAKRLQIPKNAVKRILRAARR